MVCGVRLNYMSGLYYIKINALKLLVRQLLNYSHLRIRHPIEKPISIFYRKENK